MYMDIEIHDFSYECYTHCSPLAKEYKYRKEEGANCPTFRGTVLLKIPLSRSPAMKLRFPYFEPMELEPCLLPFLIEKAWFCMIMQSVWTDWFPCDHDQWQWQWQWQEAHRSMSSAPLLPALQHHHTGNTSGNGVTSGSNFTVQCFFNSSCKNEQTILQK